MTFRSSLDLHPFVSSQGFFVSVFYCFLNSEVSTLTSAHLINNPPPPPARPSSPRTPTLLRLPGASALPFGVLLVSDGARGSRI